jgi:hypothetical protein
MKSSPKSFQRRTKARHKHAREKKRVRYSEAKDNFMGRKKAVLDVAGWGLAQRIDHLIR